MIVNAPTSTELNDVALRLYFSAWSSLIGIWSDFARSYEGFGPGNEPLWEAEWRDYLATAQAEMQSIFSLVQHSNELALKAMVCEVSPYLLLIGNDLKLSVNPALDLQFSDFRTIDAVDLPAAVNNFCLRKLSPQFVQTYNDVRAFRNKFVHLGHSDRRFDPFELLHSLIALYAELWPQKRWLEDRVGFASQERRAFFEDGKHFSILSEIMYEQEYNLEIFTKSEFKIAFGEEKSKRRYFCFDCLDGATTDWSSFGDAAKTAFIPPDNRNTLGCAMCSEIFKVMRVPCTHDGCKGDVLGDNADDNDGRCHTCGEHTDSIE